MLSLLLCSCSKLMLRLARLIFSVRALGRIYELKCRKVEVTFFALRGISEGLKRESIQNYLPKRLVI